MSEVETMALSLPSKTTMRGRCEAASSGVRAQNVKTMTRSPTFPLCAVAPLRQQMREPRSPAMA